MDYRRAWVEIGVDRLLGNYSKIRAHLKPETKMMAVVKADAYGHGAPFVARLLAEAGVEYLAVACLDEAKQIRAAGVNTPLLVMGYTPPKLAGELCALGISQGVFSLAYAKELAAYVPSGDKLVIHIEIDTGMNRLGLGSCSAVDEAAEIATMACFDAEGIFTHFSCADEEDKTYPKEQYAKFREVLDGLEQQGVHFALRHAANSAATLAFPEMQLDMVRPGLILYGLYPSEHVEQIGLEPVMGLKATLMQVKDLKAGGRVSYGGTFTAPRDMISGIVSAGYADGLIRKCGGMEMTVAGQAAAVLGRICMDMTVVDLSEISQAVMGSTVDVFGHGALWSVDDIAELTETINYEVCCLMSKRVPRVYVKDGKEVEILKYV